MIWWVLSVGRPRSPLAMRRSRITLGGGITQTQPPGMLAARMSQQTARHDR